MYAEIIDQHLPEIRKDLEKLGLTYRSLQDDILDHICCMVEEEMDGGKDFHASYQQVMSNIDYAVISDIQHQTLLLLDKKFQQMKKFMYGFGLTGSILTIIGAVFKMLHWPGAAVMMGLGFLIIVAVFLPYYFILSYREQTEKPKRIYPVVGYLSILLVFTGALFKVMHWPGAGVLIYASMIFLLVGFLPLYIVQIFKRTTGKKINMAYIIMLMVGLSIVIVLLRVNISGYAVDRYTEMTLEYDESCRLLKQGTASMLSLAGDSVITEEIVKITAYSDSLEMMADKMLGKMLEITDHPGVPIDQAERRDYRNAGREAFLANGLGSRFKDLTREYMTYILDMLKNPVMASQVKIDLLFSSEQYIKGWTPEDHVHDPMIENYYSITTFKRAVLNAENISVEYLLSSGLNDFNR